MKNSNNKGFTLMELMVCIALMSAVMVGLLLLMSSASKLYAKVNYKQEMLTESQLVMAQVNDRVMDCNAGIAWNNTSGELYIVQEIGGTYKVHYYTMDGTDLLYKTKTWEKSAITASTDFLSDFTSISSDDAKLAEDIEAFDITIELQAGSDVVDSILVTTKFAQNGEEYEGTQLIYLRNQPIISSDNSVKTLITDLMAAEEAAGSGGI